MDAQGLPGGANAAVTTTAVAVDLSALAGYLVSIVCDQDVYFCFTTAADTSTTLVTGAQAASRTALVADPVGATVKVVREVTVKYTRLVVQTVSGSGTLRIKPVRVA